MYMTWIRLSLEYLHLIGTYIQLSCLNVKVVFSCPSRLYLYFSIIHKDIFMKNNY